MSLLRGASPLCRRLYQVSTGCATLSFRILTLEMTQHKRGRGRLEKGSKIFNLSQGCRCEAPQRVGLPKNSFQQQWQHGSVEDRQNSLTHHNIYWVPALVQEPGDRKMNKTLLARPHVLNHLHHICKCLGQGPSLRLVCLPLWCQGDTAHNTHAVLPVLSELWSWLKVAPQENPVSETQWQYCLSQYRALLILVYYQFHFLMLTFHRKVKFTRLSKRLLWSSSYCLCLLFKYINLIYL